MTDLNLTGYKLTFSDEFNTRSISATGQGTTWADTRSEWVMSEGKADVGFGHSSFVDPSSGYDPFKVEGGALTITATGDVTPSGFPGSMESGLITTQGNWSQKQGYFEMRADLSDAPHAWDAFWMMPDQQVKPGTGSWQELDVVEHYGDNDRGVYSTIHTTDPQNGIPWQENRQVYSESANKDGYHTYGVLWEGDKLSFYVDGDFKGSQATPSDYSNPQYMMANLATLDGAVGGEQMKIDYIRAYSKDGSNPTVALGQVSAPDGHDPGMYGATALNGSATAAVDHTTDVVVPPPPAAPPIVAADDVPPVTLPVVAANDVPPAVPAVVTGVDSSPATPPVVAADDSPPATAPVGPPVVAADEGAPVTPPVMAADDSPPVTPPVMAADDSPPVTPPVMAANDSPPVTPPVMAADDSSPVTPPVVAADGSAPGTPPVVTAGDIPPAAPPVVAANDASPVVAADDGQPATHANEGYHGHGRHGAHDDLHFDQMGLSADAAHDFGGGQLAHMLADIMSSLASVAFIQTMQSLAQNISHLDAAQGARIDAWFDQQLGNEATADLAAMMDNAGGNQHQHFENHHHCDHGWG